MGRCPTVQEVTHWGYTSYLLTSDETEAYLFGRIIDVESVEAYYEEWKVEVLVIETIVPTPVECRLSATDNALVLSVNLSVFVDIYIFRITCNNSIYFTVGLTSGVPVGINEWSVYFIFLPDTVKGISPECP